MKHALLAAAALAAAGCATAPASSIIASSVTGDAACTPDAGDKAWLSRAPEVWPLVSRSILKLPPPETPVTYRLFDAACTYTSVDAQTWTAEAHNGQVRLAFDGEMPVGVSSFVMPIESGGAMMVMALPTIWRAGDVTSEMGLETLMFAVLAHEMAHTRQMPIFTPQLEKLAGVTGHGEDLTDDVIQDTYETHAGVAASVARETVLLFAAAAAADDGRARTLAAEAMALFDARRKTWLSGDSAPLGEMEDIFLTMEGAGQYAGLAWLADPAGGGLSRDAALAGMRRGKRWSQDEGLALFMALDRLAPGWPQTIFSADGVTAPAALRATLAAPT